MSRCLFIFFTFLPLTLFAQRLDFDVYSIDDGLPKLGVYDIFQDSRGHLWIGTEGGGVSRFDGFTFTNFNIESGLRGNFVRVIQEDKDGKIWVGMQYGGLNLIDHDSILSPPEMSLLNGKHIRAITQDHTGTVWVGTMGSGLIKIDPENSYQTRSELDFSPKNIRQILLDSKTRLWIGSDEGLFLKMDSAFVKMGETRFNHPQILALFEDSNGKVWVGTKEGFFIIEDGNIFEPEPNELSSERIKAISEDCEGDIWMGTQRGAFRIDKEFFTQNIWEFERYTSQQGLSNERIRKIFKDRNNALWFATYFGGICRLTQQNFSFYTEENSFPEKSITALAAGTGDSFYVGTFEGDVYRIDNNLAQNIHQESADSENAVLEFEIVEGGLFVLQANRTLLHFDSMDRLDQTYKLEPNRVHCVLASGNELLLGTDEGIEIHEGAQNYDLPGDPAPAVYDLKIVADTFLYAATEEGVFYTDLRAPENWEVVKGTDNISVRSLTVIRNERLWATTLSHGVLQIRGSKSRNYKNPNHFSSRSPSFVITDSLGYLWVGGLNGVDQIETDPDQKVLIDSKHWGVQNGFLGGEVNLGSAMVDTKGDLWFGTLQGLLRFSHHSNYTNDNPPLLSLDDIRLFYEKPNWNEIEAVWSDKGTLPSAIIADHEQNNFTFHFTGIDLSQPSAVKYQYYLEGYEPDWRPMTSDRLVTYAELPPGDFNLKLRSRNSQGVWNEQPLELSLKIDPPVYQKTWFQILMIVLGVILIWTFVKIRVGVLKREKKILEIRVKDRTHDLEIEKQKSEDLLLNILPAKTAEELKQFGQARTRKYEMASVLFSDFHGFTMLSEKLDSDVLVQSLDACFKAFDRSTEEYGVEKIKTIGDAYMCATGVPSDQKMHAERLVNFAFEMIKEMEKINATNKAQNLPLWNLRIGIHSGQVIAGVVGEKKFAYDIWGDAVNTAARMESSGEPGKINISEATYELVKNSFVCKARGKIKAKNKGDMEMYFVMDKKKKE